MPKFQMTLGVRLWSYVREEASYGRVTFSSLAHIHGKHLSMLYCSRYGDRTGFVCVLAESSY
jgi:hypothetical protein